jgi:hypothetical protein
MRAAFADRALLGGALAGRSWRAWCILLIAAMGEALTRAERAIFHKLTGRDHEPLKPVEEFEAVVGRRGGKSRAMATLACYIGGLCDHSDVLAPGEQGVLQRQASITLEYTTAAFEGSPILSQLIQNRAADALEHQHRDPRGRFPALARADLHRRDRR